MRAILTHRMLVQLFEGLLEFGYFFVRDNQLLAKFGQLLLIELRDVVLKL